MADSAPAQHIRHADPDPAGKQGFLAEFRDAISVRTVGLVVGVLLLQLGFVLSYVGAFHQPTPHRVPVQVVAPASASAQAVVSLNGLSGAPLSASAAVSKTAARDALTSGQTDAVLIISPTGPRDRLLVASAAGAATATAVETVVTGVESAQHRHLSVTDALPTQPGDARGLTGFYLVIGWLVGGYLVASLLGVAKGARPATPRRAVFRLIALVPYAIVSGLGGALIVDQWLGALTGHFWALAGLGVLLVLSSATATLAFQVLLGTIGIGVTVLLFVVLGNPSAGGAYAPPLLPPFWRAISPALPNGAGTSAVRDIVYFGGAGVTARLLVICGYAVGGAVVALVAAVAMHRTGRLGGRGSRPGGRLRSSQPVSLT